MKIFSFFAGAGFLDLGFEKSGYEIVFSNEISREFSYAYQYSRKKMGMPFPKYGTYETDITIFLNDERHSKLLGKWIKNEKKAT